MTPIDVIAWLGAGALGAVALDRLLLWMEAKGWIYWRKVKRKGGGGAAAALISINAVYDPSAHHTAEAREEQEMEDEDDGDDDGQRPASDRLIR
jgi:hypothetical protein